MKNYNNEIQDNEILADCAWFADKHRGKNKQSGPYWSTIIRFPKLYDEAVRLQKRVDTLENYIADYCSPIISDKYSEIEHLQARIAELEQERRWIPVSERMPEEGQTVFVCTRDRKIHEWLYSTALKSIFTRHVLYWKSKLMPVASEGEEE